MGFKAGFFTVVCLINWHITIAQQKSVIIGNLTDTAGTPLAMATVILFKNSAFMATSISDSLGGFTIYSRLQKDSAYTLQISMTGFQPLKQILMYADSLTIYKLQLLPEKDNLQEVRVTAQKQLVTRKADRFVINVENSYLANGNNGLEVLQKSPGLWVSADGNIRIKGNQPVLVMINDVVQRMSTDELSEYLRSLSSESISKIEVIQNPPAEYEAAGAGGIVHIILKKIRKDGFTGSVNGTYRRQGRQSYMSGFTAAEYRSKLFYFSGNSSFSRDKNNSTAYSNVAYPDGSLYNTEGTRDNDNRRQLYRFTVGYDMAPDHFIGLQHMRIANQFYNTFETSSLYRNNGNEVKGVAFTGWKREPVFVSSTLNYSWKTDTLGSQFKIIAERTQGNKEEVNTLEATYTQPVQDLDYKILTPIGTKIYTVQTDFLKVVSNTMQWSGGVKFAATGKDNRFIREDHIGGAWIKDTLVSNHFRYDEKLLMLYAAIEKTFGNTAVKAGLRAEKTFSKGISLTTAEAFDRSFTDLFPSFFIRQSLNEAKGNGMHFSYSRRIVRPGFRELNPYSLQFDNHTIMLGNPLLLPQYTHALETGFEWHHKYMATLYYSVTNHVIGQLASPVAGNIIEYQYKNLDKNREYGVTITAPVTLLKKWQITNNVLAYQSEMKIKNSRLKQSTLALKTAHFISLKKLADIEMIAEYRSRYVNANSIFASLFYCDVGLSRKIVHNKIRIKLYCSDIANTLREKEITDYAGTHIFFYQKRQTRNFSISLNYSFSAGKKFSSKKIETGSSDR